MASVYSKTHVDLAAAIQARVGNWGVEVDPSQFSALALDIEQVIVSDQATCVADAISDLGINSDPPEDQQ